MANNKKTNALIKCFNIYLSLSFKFPLQTTDRYEEFTKIKYKNSSKYLWNIKPKNKAKKFKNKAIRKYFNIDKFRLLLYNNYY